MRVFFHSLCAIAALYAGICGASEIPAIAYHDIVTQRNGDPYAVTVDDFKRQLEYLKREGYQPISLALLDQAREGRAALPAKPVLLSFDDGLKSYHEHAHPILRAHGFPSVIGIVTAWTDGRAAAEGVRARFMSWQELRALARSPLVEILSHTDDLHRYLPMNRRGGRMPAAVTRFYDTAADVYETDAQHVQRVRADLARSVARIREELDRAPIGIVWPYGMHDRALAGVAQELGMRYSLTLDSATGAVPDPFRIDRVTFVNYRGLADLTEALQRKRVHHEQIRFVEIDLARFVGLNEAGQERLLSRLLSRLQLLHVNGVLLDAFTADRQRAYFHNSSRPVAADVLSDVTQRLLSRAGIRHIYLRLSANVDDDAIRDLARLNWFTGVAIDNRPTAADLARIGLLVRYYKPDARLGVVDSAIAHADFTLTSLSAEQAERALVPQVQAALAAHPRALLLLRRGSQTPDDMLRRAMLALRSAGAAHYGYGPDDFESDAPAVLRIVNALHEHTITRR